MNKIVLNNQLVLLLIGTPSRGAAEVVSSFYYCLENFV